MRCPACGRENPADARFCNACGARLETTCDSCGHANPLASRFCNGCGQPIVGGRRPLRPPDGHTPKYLAEKILHSRTVLEGERKQVTVLFADLKGSMELLADRDPEEARTLLDPVLEHMMEAVHRYEGTVNQVMGDGIMALFGAPLAHEEHAARACYAALRMQERVKKYAEDVRRTHGVTIRIRVGVNSGEVVVREIGSDLRMDYTAVGQTTHLAARMEQLAEPGTILLSPATLALVEGLVQVTDLGPLPVKGLAAPIEVYELTGISAARSRLQAAAVRGLSRFVGRHAELEQLGRAIDQAGQGRGQVAAIVGGPGVGKSRLTLELTHSPQFDGWLSLRGGAVSYGQATSYLPVIALLKSYFQIDDRDGQREIRDKVTSRVLVLDRALEATLPALLSLLDVAGDDPDWQVLDPSRRRQRILDAVKHLLLREARTRPVLVVLEDLHWVDAESQAVLDGLVESLPSAALLLLVNYRPEYEHHWGTKASYTQLRLDPLPPESAFELLHGLLGDDETIRPLAPMLIERTEGNPFFLEESVRALIETKALVGTRGAYRLVKALTDIQVPPTVQAILAARIDRLSPDDKWLLQSAAVIGKDVPFVLLAAVVEEREEALRQGLAHLQAAEFFYEASLFPDLAYTFKHALTHEVAYGSLLHERRRTLHARIVGALEQVHAGNLGEQLERLAHHAVRGEAWEQALSYSAAAGAKALGRSAFRDATTWHEQALSALAHLPETRARLEQAVDLRLLLRNSLQPVGELHRLLQYLSQAEATLEKLGDRRRQSWLWSCQANCHWLLGEHERGVEPGHRAVDAAMAVGDPHLLIGARWNLSMPYWGQGKYRRALDCVLENHAALTAGLVRSIDTTAIPGSSTHPAVGNPANAAWYLAELGEFGRAAALGEEAVRAGEALQHSYSLTLALFHLGGVYLRRGDVARAVATLERSRQLAESGDYPFYLPWASARLGAAYLLAGRAGDSLALLKRTIEVDAVRTAQAEISLWWGWLAEAYLANGQPAEAAALAKRALDLAVSHGERGHQAWALRLQAELAAELTPADLDAAETLYQRALALAQELEMRPLEAHCHFGLGKVYRRTGQRGQSQEHVGAAAAMYREMEMRLWLEQAVARVGDGQSRARRGRPPRP